MPADDGQETREVGRAERDGNEHVNAVLSAWDGAHAIVLGCSMTHRHLRIELWKAGHDTQLVVACLSPEYFGGPLQWAKGNVRVVRVTPDDRWPSPRELELRDDSAGVRVVCDDVHLVEEPADFWRRGPGDSVASAR